MKKIIRKILTATCALVMCIFCLTGCSWLELNNELYYNRVVVSIGDIKDFNKKDLVEAFNSYGYQYYSQYQMSMEESVNQTIESMIDRYLLMEVVKKEITLTDEEKLQIKKEAFDYMQDSVNTYEDQVRKEWGLELKFESTEEGSTLRTEKTEYNPTTKFENGVVSRIEADSEEEPSFIEDDFASIEHFTKDYKYRLVTDEKVSNEAWTRYVKALQDGAKSEGRSTKESDVLLYEEERLIELISNNKYLEKYEEAFLDRADVDVDSVLKYYREQYLSQKELFENDESLYHTAMENASSEYVYYHVNSGQEYVNCKHILINFNDYQVEEIKNLNSRYGIADVYSIADIKDEDTREEYQRQLDDIVNQTKTTIDRDLLDAVLVGTGVNAGFSGDTVYASDVYKLVGNYIADQEHVEQAIRFDNLVYIFNDDDGFMNSEFDYVVNLDENIQDKMVKTFADGVRGLNDKGVGAIDKVVTEYGIHIIFNDGNAGNIVNEATLNSDEHLLSILCNTMTTPNSNKSIFNYIYDKLSLDEGMYDNMTRAVVATERSKLKANNIKIYYYENRYKDLWK